MNVAVIPARAGSRGIPGKNYQYINGKPLVAWSIEAAVACRRVDLVIVSSNCPEVEKVTQSYISKCPWLHYLPRPDEISDDFSLTEDALVHAVEYAMEEVDVTPHWVTLLQPTSPVRNDQLLDQCCDAVLDSDIWDSLLTCSEHTPFFYKLGHPSIALPVGHEPCNRLMRQELLASGRMLYHDNGNVAITRAEVLLERFCRTGENIHLMVTTPYQSWQIDREEDFVILEAMSKTFGPFV